jgi:nucleotide-binding universal stress UspA family protein
VHRDLRPCLPGAHRATIASEQEVIVYSQIVLPLDGGPFADRALRPALEMAERSDAPVLLVAFAHTAAHRDDLEAELISRAAVLKEATSVPVDYRVAITEDIAAAIVAEVDAEPGSLVCMSSVGRAHTEPLFGSVAEAVLREVSTPVLLIGPSVDVQRFRLSGVMEVPVDGSKHSEAVLPIAASWSIVYDLGLRVVNVVPMTSPNAPVPEQFECWMETAYVRHVAEKLRRDAQRSVDFDVLHARDVAARIVEDSSRYAAVLAIATHGRTGRSRVVAGSVAMQVVHDATVPVLAYRPLQLRR